MADTYQILKHVYYDVNSPACYAGVEKVYREAKRLNPNITRKDVERFLEGERTYTVYRSIVRKFPRLKTRASGLHTDWQADLAIFISTARKNNNYKYLLVVVDVLSRRVYVEPVKTKRSIDMIPAFERIFERAGTTPWRLYTDRGLEFVAKPMLNYFESKGIQKLNAYTNPVVHASIVERMNRTIKEKLYKYFAENNTKRWVDVIQNIADGINKSVSRITKMRPIDVTYDNAEELRKKLYNVEPSNKKKPKFKAGDVVRFANVKLTFNKGAENFTDGLYVISKVYSNHIPVVYTLVDDDGDTIKGYFYERELVKANRETAYKIKKVLRSKIKDGEKWYYVKYAGFRDLCEWIPESALV